MGSNTSAKRVNLNWGDGLKRAQRLTDGLPNKYSSCEHRGETSHHEDEPSCNASGARGFSFALLSAETHLTYCDKPVVALPLPVSTAHRISPGFSISPVPMRFLTKGAEKWFHV